VKFGKECTEFLHANASIKNRNNNITSLVSENSQEFFDHEEKAMLLWNAFKERLGTSEFTHIYLDLQSLLSHEEGLEALDILSQEKKLTR
jgi:hypothetical protein